MRLAIITSRIAMKPANYGATTQIAAKKTTVDKNGFEHNMYYVNDGVYGSFLDELLQIRTRVPQAIDESRETQDKHLSTLWGPTCDSLDCIVKDVMMPEYQLGDWLYWKDMGAYSTCLGTNFNGFGVPIIFPVMRRSNWNDFMSEISKNNQVIVREIDDEASDHPKSDSDEASELRSNNSNCSM
ncbi:ornithine decarboxylase-like [Copidosoma floridanum]|uniref:ornithine decarboxylase-like n=1 Tax=Copidosoma floridanum TaxID=29053 RepID=UPI000C6FC23D|nr:ornithine decarboxylase-like [Copidosoma floridanum]